MGGDKELRSSMIADEIIKKLGYDNIQLINVSKLKYFLVKEMFQLKKGNTCG
jgi:hypothetical protein